MTESPTAQYFDRHIQEDCVFVQAGYHHVGRGAISTFLGSCVAACIRDKNLGLGGLNHFLLPSGGDGDTSSRYGVNAMEVLINDILRQGGSKDALEAKLFGGASILGGVSSSGVGHQNALFVKNYLQVEGIEVLATDLGGTRARRVYYFPRSGRASILSVAEAEAQQTQKLEAELQQRAQRSASPGGVELF